MQKNTFEHLGKLADTLLSDETAEFAGLLKSVLGSLSSLKPSDEKNAQSSGKPANDARASSSAKPGTPTSDESCFEELVNLFMRHVASDESSNSSEKAPEPAGKSGCCGGGCHVSGKKAGDTKRSKDMDWNSAEMLAVPYPHALALLLMTMDEDFLAAARLVGMRFELSAELANILRVLKERGSQDAENVLRASDSHQFDGKTREKHVS
ncbi:hypothetical protein ACJU26_09850 [Acidithiobacillus sp. M4-SHS-6]|uniref:hypothetical protein n=1 Tax=Acidithiobacillus sp. M4-SHS-6 TaxID=3383024 RepID=UPI0039BDB900